MKTTEYLYGIQPEELKDMLYFDALKYKYDACTRLFRKLYLTDRKTDEQNLQLWHVTKAQEHTEKLLLEKH